MAAEMHPAFVRLLVEEALVPAEEVLTRLWPAELGRQLEALRGLLASLWRRAPVETAEVLERLPPGPRAELWAGLQRAGFAEGERAAARALAATEPGVGRARALLAVARADGDRGRVAEAMTLLARAKIWELARVAADLADVWDAEQRGAVRGLARRAGDRDRVWAAEVAVALARVAPPEEAREDAVWAIERTWDGSELAIPWRLPALTRALRFEQMRPWVDVHLRAARGLWDAFSTVPALVHLAAPDQLDAMVTMIEEGAGYPWDKVRLLALVARHHPPRHAELLARARAGLNEVVSAPGSGRGLNPAPVGGRGAATVHQVHALSGVAAAAEGEERRALQAAALERLATDAEEYEELETISPYGWAIVGERLDRSLVDRCMAVLLGFVDRYTCWGAIGGVVACFPAGDRAAGLQGLQRLAG